MPYLTNSIGQFNFISLDGEYDPEQPSLMIDSHPGVTGMDFTLTATKGQPFTLISLVDVNSLASGKQAVLEYKALIGLGTVAIWKNSELYTFAKVLNVTPLRLDKIGTAVGNKKSALAGALLRCRWDLVATP